LGRTVDSGRIWDILAVAKHLKEKNPNVRIFLNAEGRGAVLALYAALLDESITGLTLGKFPSSLMEEGAPALLNALRVCDIADVIGMLAERELRFMVKDSVPERARKILAIGQGE
jgi:hypothetical protein